MSKNQNEASTGVNKAFQKRVLKNGTVSALLAVGAIAIVVLVNILASKIPTGVKDLDLSGRLLYEVGDQSVQIMKDLPEDVRIYVVGEEQGIDERIRRFLETYAAKSSGKIAVQYVDPVTSPAFLSKHGLSKESLLVRCEATDKEKVIDFSDIVVKEMDYYAYMNYGQTRYNEVSFDGENQLANALLLVTNPATYKGYVIGGHEMTAMGESGQVVIMNRIGDSVRSTFGELGLTLSDLDLRKQGSVPEDADLVILNSPATDLSDQEIGELESYMDRGGRMIFYSVFTSDSSTNQPLDLENLAEFCRHYGIEIHNTYLGDMEYGSYSSAYGGSQKDYYTLTMRANGKDPIVSNLSGQYMLIYHPQGLTIVDDIRSSVKVTTLLESSSSAFLFPTELFAEEAEQAQFDPTDHYGTYYMGLKATETLDGKESKLIVMSGNFALEDELAKSFPGNLEMNKQIVGDCLGDSAQTVYIPAKSLQEGTNMFSSADRNMVINAIGAAVIAAVLPVVLMITGFVIWFRRRKK